jgi:hypothetical protein
MPHYVSYLFSYGRSVVVTDTLQPDDNMFVVVMSIKFVTVKAYGLLSFASGMCPYCSLY